MLAGCSLQQPPAPGPANPHLSANDNANLAKDRDAQAPPAMMELNSISPVIGHPELVEVRKALERGEDTKALELFEQALVRVDPPIPERFRWQLSLAFAYQKRNDCTEALPHFDAASSAVWPLRDYAQFGAAQCRVALGLSSDALGMLSTLKAEAPLLASVNLLKGKIAFDGGKLNQAIDIWRDYLSHSTTTSPERTAVILSLAQALYSTATDIDAGTGDDKVDARSLPIDANLKDALSILSSIGVRDCDNSTQERVFALRHAIVAKLFSADPEQEQQCRIRDQSDQLEILIEQRDFKRAQELAALLLGDLRKSGLLQSVAGCRAQFAAAQAHLGLGESAEATSGFEAIVRGCNEPEELVARSLFAVARRAQELHDLPAAIVSYETFERRFPTNRLADDARLRLAYAYLDLGSESKFTDLIMRMAEDFPQGDMTSEGLYQLVQRRISKGDWTNAVALLSQLGRLPRIVNHDDVEQSERQLYFLARAQYQNGQRDIALDGLERLVRERPFSYYMLQAYTRLMLWAPERAARATSIATTLNVDAPFTVPYQPQFDKPGYFRAIELMALGEIDKGTDELRVLQLPPDVEPLLLWTKASFEAAAGSLKSSQRLVRERMRDWPRRWPIGAWEPAWKVAFPQPYAEIVNRESKRTQVPEALVYAVMREESQFDREAVSGAEAYGLMQLIVPTAKIAARKLGMTADPLSLKRPTINVALGCQVLGKLLQKFSSLPILAIPAYNAGPGRPTRWLKERPDMDFDVWVEAIPIAETRTYLKHVLSSWATYTWLYEPDASDKIMKLPLKVGY
jgi:soluble lytic murein transglycosylase